MKILIDASNLKVGGAIQVCVSLIEQLITDRYSEHSFFYVVSEAVFNQAAPFLKSENYEVITTDIKTVSPFSSERKRIKKLAKNADKIFTVFGPTFWGNAGDKHLIGFANPWIVTPDTIAYKKFSYIQQCAMRLKVLILKNLLWNANSHYVTETDAIRRRFIDIYNCSEERISVVPNCLNYFFHDLNVTDVNDKYNLSAIKCFKFVTITHNYPHKNLSIISDVYRELLKLGVECKFIVTINDAEYKSFSDDFKQATHNIGPIPIADCPSLYKYSDALFLPTLLECFTASYLEAMKMRIPIFTSNLDFAKTICRDAAFYFNPLSVYSISTTISTAIKDECSLQEKIENGDAILESFPDHIQRVEKFMKLINGDYNV